MKNFLYFDKFSTVVEKLFKQRICREFTMQNSTNSDKFWWLQMTINANYNSESKINRCKGLFDTT